MALPGRQGNKSGLSGDSSYRKRTSPIAMIAKTTSGREKAKPLFSQYIKSPWVFRNPPLFGAAVLAGALKKFAFLEFPETSGCTSSSSSSAASM